MRWAVAGVGLLCAAITPAPAEQLSAPFAPLPNVPDYVVTMAGNSGYGATPNYVRTVMHHGAWTRAENKSASQHTIGYFLPARSIEIDLYRSADVGDEIGAAHFSRGDDRSKLWDYASRNTGERQTLLGEACTVWEVARSREGAL